MLKNLEPLLFAPVLFSPAEARSRFRIEEMFKDFKNNGRGFGLEFIGIRHADRLARLLPAFAYTWLLL